MKVRFVYVASFGDFEGVSAARKTIWMSFVPPVGTRFELPGCDKDAEVLKVRMSINADDEAEWTVTMSESLKDDDVVVGDHPLATLLANGWYAHEEG